MAENFLIAYFYVCEMRLLFRQVFKLFNDCDRPTDNPKTTPSISDRILFSFRIVISSLRRRNAAYPPLLHSQVTWSKIFGFGFLYQPQTSMNGC